MKCRIARLGIFPLIPLLSLLAFAAQGRAQDDTSNRGSGQSMRPKTEATAKAKGLAAKSPASYKVVYSFCSDGGANCTDGAEPVAGLVEDSAGNLYGTTEDGGANGFNYGTVFKISDAGAETVLYSFDFGTVGFAPLAGLIEDSAGNLYGTTNGGGNDSSGTVFKVDSATGKETVLYSFCSAANCEDGESPAAGLVEDSSGNLYGTTSGGGANSSANSGLGGGTVFKVDSSGKQTVLYSFCSLANCKDGEQPVAGLVMDADGNLYGTTQLGGKSNSNCNGGNSNDGCGVVFEVSPAGKETVLYSFCSVSNCTDGANPVAGLIRDSAGNLYGTTVSGGTGVIFGTVFKLDASGKEVVLHSFTGTPDGGGPRDSVTEDSSGNLYGTTSGGGANGNAFFGQGGGTVFEIDAAGDETVLYSFCSVANCTDGLQPDAGLYPDSDGNLYGTTSYGGSNTEANGNLGGGTVFKVTGGGGGGGGTAMVTLTSGLNPAYVGESVTLSVVVSGSGATPTGTVTFEEGSTALGTVTLADGKASFATTFAKAGTDSIVADYSGDSNYKAADSKALKQVVKQYTTSTALASSLNPSTYGDAVTLTATVSSTGPTPTGIVTFKNGSKSLGSANLSGAVAKLTTSTLAVGTSTITASYAGDAAEAKSTSADLKQKVNMATSATSVASSVNPSKPEQKVTFTATVTSPTTTPTGTVTFKDGSTELGTGTLSKGKAKYSTSTLSAGTHKITAVYAGTVNIEGSTSVVVVQTVD
jgi:uncharacterized repeat protein (TIGR03803 family)